MTDDLDDVPPHVLEAVGVDRSEWDAMTTAQRRAACEQFVEAVNDAMAPVAETITTEVVPAVVEAARPLADAMVRMADTIETAEIDHADLSPQESAQLRAFVRAARRYDQEDSDGDG